MRTTTFVMTILASGALALAGAGAASADTVAPAQTATTTISGVSPDTSPAPGAPLVKRDVLPEPSPATCPDLGTVARPDNSPFVYDGTLVTPQPSPYGSGWGFWFDTDCWVPIS